MSQPAEVSLAKKVAEIIQAKHPCGPDCPCVEILEHLEALLRRKS